MPWLEGLSKRSAAHLRQQHEQAVRGAQQRRVRRRLQQLQAQGRKGGGLQQRRQLAQLHRRFGAHGERFLCHHSQQLAGQAVGLQGRSMDGGS